MNLITINKNNIYASIALAISIPVFVSLIANKLNIVTFPTIHRVTYPIIYSTNFFGSSLNDAFIFMFLISSVYLILKRKYWFLCLASCIPAILLFINFKNEIIVFVAPAILFLIILYLNYGNLRTALRLPRVAMWFLIILSIFSLFSIIRWFVFPVDKIPFFEGVFWHIPKIEFDLFYVIANMAPYLTGVLFVSFLLLPYKSIISNQVRKIAQQSSFVTEFEFFSIKNSQVFINKIKKFILPFALFISVLIPLYALISVNPDTPVGVDIVFYLNWLDIMKAASDDQVLKLVFVELGGDQFSPGQGDRPLTLLFLYFLTSVLPFNPLHVLNSVFFILSPILVVSTYYFANQIKGKNFALIVALITPVSYHAIVGIYTAFIANWLAVITTYLALAFVVKLGDNWKISSVICLFVCSLATMFFHTYTWTYLLATVSFYILATVILKKANLKLVITLSIVFISLFAIDFLKGTLTGSNVGIESNFLRVEGAISLLDYADRWRNLMINSTMNFGGYYNNSILLFFAIVGILHLKKRNPDVLLASSIFVATIPILFGEFGVQSRLLYDVPIHVIAALGILKLWKSQFDIKLKIPALFFIFIHFFLYGIKAVSNLQFMI